jgi:hypothetical protein
MIKFTDLPQSIVAGFTLAAYRENGALIKDAFDRAMPFQEWPQALEHKGMIYTLEEVQKFQNGFENADYV